MVIVFAAAIVVLITLVGDLPIVAIGHVWAGGPCCGIAVIKLITFGVGLLIVVVGHVFAGSPY